MSTSPDNRPLLQDGQPAPSNAVNVLTPRDVDTPESSGFFLQLASTMHRQIVQKKRMPMSCCIELFLPIVFIAGIVLASMAADTDTYSAENFVLNNTAPLDVPGVLMDSLCRNGTSDDPDVNRILTQCNFTGINPIAKKPRSYVCSTNNHEHVPIGEFCVDTNINEFAEYIFGRAENATRLMPFDQMVMWQWAWKLIYVKRDGGLFSGRSVKDILLNSGYLYFTPQDDAEVQKAVKYLNATHWTFKYVYAPKQYKTHADAASYLTSVKAEGKGWAILDFGKVDQDRFEVDISMNRSSSAVPTWKVHDQFALGLGARTYSAYYTSGFLSLQAAMNDYYIRAVKGITDTMDDAASVPMPFTSYKNYVFLTVAGKMSPLVLVLSFLYGVSQLTKRLVEEKELRLREAMLIMGLGKTAFFLSWTFIYLGQALFTSTLITIILKVGVLKQSDPTVIFVCYFLFMASTITFSTLLSTFFSKSRVCALVAPILYFACSVPSFALPEGTGRGVLLLLSLFSPTAFAQGTTLLFQYEQTQGMGWNDVSNSHDVIPMGTAMFMMLFDMILYALLTIYADMVIPNEWGTRLHPCFCFMAPCKSDGTGKGKYSSGQYTGNSSPGTPSSPRAGMKEGVGHADAVEDYPDTDENCSVHLNYLLKEFDGDGGKKVAVDNFEMKLFPDQVTVLLGHNGAGKTTTMNMLTGMLEMTDGDCKVYGKSIRKQLQAARAEIGFCPQHNILWSNMTCIEHLRYFARLKGVKWADVEAQCLMMLQKVDLMPQKDQYASNLSGGQKRKLSVAIAFVGGSRLVLLDEPTAGMDVAARRHTWDLLREMSKGRTIVLTTHYMDEADLLGNRVAIMSKGTLHSYGSPMFLKNRLGTGYCLKISSDKSVEDPQPFLKHIQSVIDTATIKEFKGQELSFSLPMNQTHRFPEVMRLVESAEVRQRFGVTGVSMSVSTLEDVFLRIAHEEEVGSSSTTTTDEEAAAVIGALDGVFNGATKAQQSSAAQQVKGMFMKRLHNGRRDRRTICLQIILPLIAICFAMLLAKLGPPPQPRLVLDEGMYGSKQILAMGNCTGDKEYYNKNYEFDMQPDMNSYEFSDYLLATAKKHGQADRYVAMQCDDPVNSHIPFNPHARVPTRLLFTNATAYHSLPQMLNEYMQAFTRKATDKKDLVMQIASSPLPWGARQAAGIDSFRSLLIGFFVLIPFTFIPSTYVSWIVKERESRAKHLQFVSGANFVMYWLANYLFDLISFFVTEIIALIIFAAFKRDEFIGSGEAVGCVLLLFTLYGLSSIASSYAVSFFFTNHGSAQNIVMMANFLCGFVLVITIFILKRIESTESAAKVLVYFFRFVPSYCLGEGILALSSAPLLRTLNQEVNVFDLDEAGWAMLYMFFSFVLYTGVTIFLDHPARARAKQALSYNPDSKPPTIDNEDADVIRERQEVETDDASRRTDVVRVKNLRKMYSGGIGQADKLAVKNLSFGVKKDEVFGFLGTNGAGKTTTMSILSGEFLPTMGRCTIAGYDVVSEGGESRQNIGYCPQFDALIDLMTAEEHLALYAALRGVPSGETPNLVDALILACNLSEHRKTPSKKLSGGNKRKLSVAISLIGGPPIIMLDEPSAGMDPLARRHLWDVIIYVSKRSSVVLTTHHLEEVDVLAHRVAMMVDGEMRCIGSLDHLKHKFGGGFELNIKVGAEENVETIRNFVKNQFSNAQLIEDRQQKLTYGLSARDTRLSAVFEIMQRARDDPRLDITDYTVQQSSLEQVFIRISQHQAAIEDEEEVERQQSSVPSSQPTSHTNRARSSSFKQGAHESLSLPVFDDDLKTPQQRGGGGATFDDSVSKDNNFSTTSL